MTITYITAVSATLENNSKIINVSGEHVDFSKAADYLVALDNGLYVLPILSGTPPDNSGNSTLTLVNTWSGATLSNKGLLIFPTFAKIYESVAAMSALNDVTRGILTKLKDLLTSTDDTIDIAVGQTTSISTVPYQYLINQLQSAMADNQQVIAAAVSDIETKDQATYRNAVESASGGKNSVFWDAQGNPNVMVWINKFNSEDVNAEILVKTGVDLQLGTGTFPAFIKDGVELRGFWCAKYQASSGENGGCSVIAGAQPKASVNYDQARALCVNKGANWHMASNLEWCAVSFLSLAYGQNVRGNTSYGRSHTAKYETARRDDTLASGDTAGTGRTDCGTGPATWSHDGTIFGVFDLVGNVWEWVDQLLMQEGQIIAPLDNNPALLEAQWTAHAVYLDSSGATGGDAILNSVITNRTGDLGDNGSGNGASSNAWAVTAKDASYIENTLMRQMAIESASAINLEGRFYFRNFGERAPFRGGSWNAGSRAGLGALFFGHSRTFAGSDIGFRPALFEY
jgi:hypothetical protein